MGLVENRLLAACHSSHSRHAYRSSWSQPRSDASVLANPKPISRLSQQRDMYLLNELHLAAMRYACHTVRPSTFLMHVSGCSHVQFGNLVSHRGWSSGDQLVPPVFILPSTDPTPKPAGVPGVLYHRLCGSSSTPVYLCRSAGDASHFPFLQTPRIDN